MKILLTTLNSKYIHSNLALRYLYGVAGERARYLHLQEFTINQSDSYIFSELIRGNYDAVCFSCYIWNIVRTLSLAENLKKAKPEVKIILGGPEAAERAKQLLETGKFIDFIMLGEGEGIFPELLEALPADGPYRMLPGLAGRSGNKIFLNEPQEPVNFSEVPFPYEKLPWDEDKIIYYETVRGCPYRCSYCLSSIEKTMRERSMERVKRELKSFLDKKVRQVKLVDRTFNYDGERSLKIIRFLMEHDNDVTNFHFELCGELITEEFIKQLEKARPGLFRLEIGVQSTNEKTLKACRRQGNFEILKEKVGRLASMGNITLHLDLIAGLPHEDYNTFRKSFNDVYALMPDELQLGFLKLLPGTPLREETDRYGYVYQTLAPYEVIASDFLSAESMVRIKGIESVFDLYYNRGGFRQTLAYAGAALGETPFDFFEEFADFYYLKGYQHRSHGKEDLYRILYQYSLWKERKIPQTAERMQELLREDMADALNPEAVKKFERRGWELRL